MKLARLHFEGRANIWFRFYQTSRGIVPWPAFVNDLVLRFENPKNRDVQVLFNKLKQTGRVSDYEDQLEELIAQVIARNRGFNEEYFVSSFVSGLKEHIKLAVKIFRPQSLTDVIFLAKQEESKGNKSSLMQSVKPVSNYKSPSLKQQRNTNQH